MDTRAQLVVARYDENLSWLAKMDFPALVYDKSGAAPPALPPHAGLEQLPNTGRETHTYLTHIVQNYPDFPEATVFLQGEPFQHMEEGWGPQELSAAILHCLERKTPFKGFAFYKLRCDALGRPHHLRDESSRGRWAGFGRDIPVGEVFAALFAGEVPESFHVRAPAGLFLVRRERILARPLAFWQAALALSEADPHDERNTGHAFERLWYLIFDGYEKRTKPHYPAASG